MRDPRAAGRVFAGYVMGGLLVGLIVAAVLHSSHRGVRPWLVVVLVTAAATLLGAVLVVFRAQYDAPPTDRDIHDADATGDYYRSELWSLEHTLHTAVTDPGHFDRTLRPVLADLIGQRLRTRHGIDPRADPDRARLIMGASLWQITAHTGDPTPPTSTQLSEWLARIRAI